MAKSKAKAKNVTLLSMAEAAETVGVTTRSIYYHVSKSHKLQAHWRFTPKDRLAIYVSKDNLLELYPAVPAGVKQKLSDKRYPVTFAEWQVKLSDLKGQIARSRKEERKAKLQARFMRYAMLMVD